MLLSVWSLAQVFSPDRSSLCLICSSVFLTEFQYVFPFQCGFWLGLGASKYQT
jgi:hypothetical protein